MFSWGGGKRPIYFRFFLLKASLSQCVSIFLWSLCLNDQVYYCLIHFYKRDCSFIMHHESYIMHHTSGILHPTWNMTSWYLTSWHMPSWHKMSWHMMSWNMTPWNMMSWNMMLCKMTSRLLMLWNMTSWSMTSWNMTPWNMMSWYMKSLNMTKNPHFMSRPSPSLHNLSCAYFSFVPKQRKL